MTTEKNNRDAIVIQGLAVECVIGFYAEELHTPQRVYCDLTLGLDISVAGRKGRITETCDYVTVADEVTALLQFRKYKLLENAAEELAAMLLGNHSIMQNLTVRIHKPGALKDRAKSVAIEISRSRADFPSRTRPYHFGEIETLLETKNAVFSLVRVQPDAEFTTPVLKKTHLLSWLVAGKATRGNHTMPAFQPVQEPGNQPGTWKNVGKETVSIFCCEMKAPG